MSARTVIFTDGFDRKFAAHPDQFVRRHIGPNADETGEMLALLGFKNLDELIDAAVPEKIRLGKKLESARRAQRI